MRITTVLTTASAALFCVLAVAQESTDPAQSISETELKSGDVRASHLLGAAVKRLTGDSIGEVEDLIVSAGADVRLAIISVGGLLGVGSKTIAIPFDQFTVAPDGSTIYLTMSEEELEARPAFDLEGTNRELSSAAEPAQPETRADLAAADAQSFGASASNKTTASRQPASTLIGAQVLDEQQSAVATINDLIVTAEPPEVQVILELSGGSEQSSRLVAVPLPELTIARDGEDPHRRIQSVETTLTVAQLENLPQFQY